MSSKIYGAPPAYEEAVLQRSDGTSTNPPREDFGGHRFEDVSSELLDGGDRAERGCSRCGCTCTSRQGYRSVEGTEREQVEPVRNTERVQWDAQSLQKLAGRLKQLDTLILPLPTKYPGTNAYALLRFLHYIIYCNYSRVTYPDIQLGETDGMIHAEESIYMFCAERLREHDNCRFPFYCSMILKIHIHNPARKFEISSEALTYILKGWYDRSQQKRRCPERLHAEILEKEGREELAWKFCLNALIVVRITIGEPDRRRDLRRAIRKAVGHHFGQDVAGMMMPYIGQNDDEIEAVEYL